jgi:hypothetical protein
MNPEGSLLPCSRGLAILAWFHLGQWRHSRETDSYSLEVPTHLCNTEGSEETTTSPYTKPLDSQRHFLALSCRRI